MEVINRTPFVAQCVILPDRDGYEQLVAVLKGTFTIGAPGCLPAAEQAPVIGGDEHYGDPETTSTRYESDCAPFKPATDVVLVGHAYAPQPGARESDVWLRVGPVGLAAHIFGDRQWSVTMGSAVMTVPQPFEKVPLVYERAFGGVQRTSGGEAIEAAYDRNPVGTGFVTGNGNARIDGLALPNIEDPRDLLKKPGQAPRPVGFGYVGRHWAPRRQFCGTYDDEWARNRMPLVPVDFDDLAWCGAPAALQATPHLRGGEPVNAVGVSPNGGSLDFWLPAIQPAIEALFCDAWTPLLPLLDTVVIEPDLERISLTWRARLRVHGRVRRLRAVRMKVEG